MAEQFYTILTKIGMAILANSAAMGNKVNFLKVKLGDGNGSYYNPSDTQTELVNQVWEGNVGSVKIDEENSNWIIVETVIPATDGGFYIREGGVYDDNDNLIAISKLAETYKPLASEGSSKDLIVRQIFEISNADSVTLKLDPTVILATKKDVQILQTAIDKINAQLNEKMSLYVGETLPEVGKRDFKTVYFKVTDMVNTNTNGIIKASPTMGLKEV